MILGYGAIGRQIAPVCQALGMEVTGVRRHTPAHAVETGVAVHPVTALPALLPTTDILICVLPQTPETVGLIGAAAIEAIWWLQGRLRGEARRWWVATED